MSSSTLENGSSTERTIGSESLSMEIASKENKMDEYITVKMKGFKFYKGTKTFVFPRYKTTYIFGGNGTGKSTIYRAIQWAIFPKKNDKVHPFGTNRQVSVKVNFGTDLSIKRTATPGTILVSYKGNKYRAEDAEALISRLFGSSKIYKMCINRNTRLHPFIEATGPQRVEILNEMIGNKEEVKKKLTSMFSTARSEVEKANLSYTKERTRYKALYKGETLDTTLILEQDIIDTLNDKLTKLKKSFKEGEISLKKLETLKARKLQLVGTHDKYKSFNDDELCELSLQRKLCNEYFPLDEKLTSTLAKLEKLLSCTDISKIPILSEEDLNKVIVVENIYKQHSKKAKDLNVVYEEAAIEKRKRELELCINQETAFKEYHRYKEMETEVSKAKAKVSKIRSNITSDEVPLLSDIAKQIDSLEVSLSYQPLWQKHQEMKELKRKLEISQTSKDIDQLKIRVKELKEILSYEKTLLLRIKYENKWSTISKKYSFSDSEWYSDNSRTLEEVRQRLESLIKTLNEIKLSESMVKCPHCDGCVRIVNGKLVKYEGQIVKLDKKQLENEIKALNELSLLSCPIVPEEIMKVCMKDIDAEKTKLEYSINLLTQLKAYDNLENLPESYSPPPDNARVKIRSLKVLSDSIAMLLIETENYSQLKNKLDGMICPTVKSTISLSEIEKAKNSLVELSKIVIVKSNEYSFEVYKLRAEHDRLQTKLSTLVKPTKAVTEQDIIKYTSSLETKKQSQRDIEEIKNDISKISWTSDKLKSIKEEIKEIEMQLATSSKHSMMLKAYEKLQKVRDKKSVKRSDLKNLQDFKEIFDRECKACITNALLSIQYTTNEFLGMLSDVKIFMTMDTSIKIECIKQGFNCGSIKELSDGEASLVSFGLNIAFALESNFDLLILDEVTDKLSSVNKDMCIEILFDIMSKNKKTLILTDHHHHSGDYDNIIELGKKKTRAKIER